MRVAIVHYWLLKMRGGEKVVEALCRLFPNADVFTLFYDPRQISETIRSHRITASFLNPARRFHRWMLPLAPLALESFDLRDYDLVISSESGPAKGVLTRTGTAHLCYCHTPMRYLWHLYADYLIDWTPAWRRCLLAPLAVNLRLWDFASAARVDEFVANSENVRRRIWKCYRRQARVIYPPVEVETFSWKPPQDYFLAVAELVAYKRLDYAVRCFAANGRQLKVVGEGPEYRRLKRLARDNIEFCGRVPDDELRDLFSRCRALVIPGEEDFGITAVEAAASGKPVIALGLGGVLESVPPEGRFFYDAPAEQHLNEALRRFDATEASIPVAALEKYAARFSASEFDCQIMEAVRGLLR